ncbi:MAG: hypothetical protein ACTSRZ_06485 [Promethearchaeota archaeon]
MVFHIFIGRHAKADNDPIWKDDKLKPISAEGKRIQFRICRKLKEDLESLYTQEKININIKEVWISPFMRAHETYEIYKRILKTFLALPNSEPKIIDELMPSGNPKILYSKIIQSATQLHDMENRENRENRENIQGEKITSHQENSVEYNALLLIGHTPCFNELLNILIPNQIEYLHSSELVWIEFEQDTQDTPKFKLKKIYTPEN